MYNHPKYQQFEKFLLTQERNKERAAERRAAKKKNQLKEVKEAPAAKGEPSTSSLGEDIKSLINQCNQTVTEMEGSLNKGVEIEINAEPDPFFPEDISSDDNSSDTPIIVPDQEENTTVRKPTLPTPPVGSGPGKGKSLPRPMGNALDNIKPPSARKIVFNKSPVRFPWRSEAEIKLSPIKRSIGTDEGAVPKKKEAWSGENKENEHNMLQEKSACNPASEGRGSRHVPLQENEASENAESAQLELDGQLLAGMKAIGREVCRGLRDVADAIRHLPVLSPPPPPPGYAYRNLVRNNRGGRR